MAFWNRLRLRVLKAFAPELFSGAPQPHERQDLVDGPVIQKARQEGLLNVREQTVAAQLDGDRALLQFSVGTQLWLDADGADGLAHLLAHIAQQIRSNNGEMIAQTRGERAANAIEIKQYSFLVQTSLGLFRFDKKLPGAFINPGVDIAYATVQFGVDENGEIVCDDGWERAL
jgi:hypothetical protein